MGVEAYPMKDPRSAILLAITISLAAHALVLAVLLWQSSGVGDHVSSDNQVEVALVNLTPELIAQLDEPPALPVSADVQNLSQNLDRSTESASLQNQSFQGNIDQMVADELAQFEADAFQEFAEGRRGTDGGEDLNTGLQLDEGGRFDDITQANPEGNVTASWSLKDRDLLYGPKPSYRCQKSGTVKVAIVVGQDGKLTQAQVDPSGTNTANTCLLEESVKYARRWMFRSKSSAPKKQSGFVIFTFVQQ